jgi:hypothetical protein
MKTFVKHYIGKGKKVEGLAIVKVTCKLEDLQKFAYFYDGVEYVSFEVAKMKEPDQFGRDYTVYVNQQEEAEAKVKDKKPAYKSKKKSTKAKSPEVSDDLPF